MFWWISSSLTNISLLSHSQQRHKAMRDVSSTVWCSRKCEEALVNVEKINSEGKFVSCFFLNFDLPRTLSRNYWFEGGTRWTWLAPYYFYETFGIHWRHSFCGNILVSSCDQGILCHATCGILFSRFFSTSTLLDTNENRDIDLIAACCRFISSEEPVWWYSRDRKLLCRVLWWYF